MHVPLYRVRFRTILVDFLRTLDYLPSRFDRDIWMRLRDDKSGYDYICTHVDALKIVAKDPTIWNDRIAAVCLIKEHGARSYYLGNDYTYHDGKRYRFMVYSHMPRKRSPT